MKNLIPSLLVVLVVAMSGSVCVCDDWPQWRGVNRDGQSAETGLLDVWLDGGPKMIWFVDGLGSGYASTSIADGMIFTTGLVGDKGLLFAFDLEGKLLWKADYGPVWTESWGGARTTPTVDGDDVYVMSGKGKVSCFDRKKGKKKWSFDGAKKFNLPRFPRWGMSESVLLVDNKVIFTPGAPGATMAALSKKTGKVVWATKSLSEESSYCSPLLVEHKGKKMIVTQAADSVVAVDPKSGKVLWKDAYADYLGKQRATNVNTPLFADGWIYATSGYGDGGAMLALSSKGTSVERKWVDRTLDTHHGGVVLVDGHIFGTSHKGRWVCVEWKTGKVKYEEKGIGKGAVIAADGMLYCYEERNGTVALAEATPAGFRARSRFQITKGEGKHWAHPAISDGVLYMRHGEYLMAFDIGEAKADEVK